MLALPYLNYINVFANITKNIMPKQLQPVKAILEQNKANYNPSQPDKTMALYIGCTLP